MKRIFIYVLMTLSLSFVSCEVEKFAPIQTLDVDCKELVAPGIGAGYTLSVSSNTAWQAELTSDGWISCNLDEFVGSTSLNIVFDANEGASRSCELVLSSEDGSLSTRVLLRQGAKMEDGLMTIAQMRALETDGEKLFMYRPAFGGNLMATIMCTEHRPQMSTVRPGVMHFMHRGGGWTRGDRRGHHHLFPGISTFRCRVCRTWHQDIHVCDRRRIFRSLESR